MITKADALQSLRPGSEWVIRGDELEWLSTDITQPTDAEIEAEVERLIAEQPAKEARAKRDRLIAETDWMALSDVQMSDGWAAYRQALRDVPEQPGFPDNIDWPQKPEKPE